MMKILGCDDDEAETKLTALPKLTDEEQKEILVKWKRRKVKKILVL